MCTGARISNAATPSFEPAALPAATAIDWTDLGTPIGERARPMRPATRARIAAGLRRYRVPIVVPAGSTWRDRACPVTGPLLTRTARENDGFACMPFLVPLRSGRPRTIPVIKPMATVVADGFGQGLAVPRFSVIGRAGQADLPTAPGGGSVLVPYYRTGVAQPVSEPVGTLSTRDRYGLATATTMVTPADVDEALFRMLRPPEIGRAMAFADSYIVFGSQREKIRQYGNAVTPPIAEVLVRALVTPPLSEVLVRALVEAITGQSLDAGRVVPGDAGVPR